MFLYITLLYIIFLNNIVIANNHLFTIYNNCQFSLNIYSNENNNFNQICNLNTLTNCQILYNQIESGLIKTSLSESATLFEFTINNKGIWYDLSVIPPGSGNCYSYEECKSISNKTGYNHPIEVIIDNPNINCKNLICLSEKCPDAYLYPFDDIKTHFCKPYTKFKITYCPNNNLTSNNNINNLTSDIICDN